MTPEEAFRLDSDLERATAIVGLSTQTYQKVIRHAGDHANGDLISGLALLTAAVERIAGTRARLSRQWDRYVRDDYDTRNQEERKEGDTR